MNNGLEKVVELIFAFRENSDGKSAQKAAQTLQRLQGKMEDFLQFS
jgi:hypothetical protein